MTHDVEKTIWYRDSQKLMLEHSDLEFEVLGAVDQVYEVELIELLKQIARPQDHFVDVGANIGFYSLALAEIVDRVSAIEPCKETCVVLKRNCERNQIENVEIMNFGLCDRDGTENLFIMGRSGGSNTFSKDVVRSSETPPMKTQRIPIKQGDSVFSKQSVQILKIDVEGLELQVLQGFQKTIVDSQPIILIEIWPERRPAVCEFLEELEYECWFGFPRYPHMALCKPSNLIGGSRNK